jgi:hypothetical protein
MAFNYQARNEDAWKKRADQSGSQFDSFTKDEFKNYALRKGENCVRILPPTWDSPAHYGYDVWIHYSVGPNQGTVLCLQKMRNQKCPICEAHVKAESIGREDAKDLKPGRRVLVWILDRKEETTPVLWAMAWTVDRDISKICKDRQSGELYQIDHPNAGFDLSFDKEGEKLQTKYTGFQLARRPSSVADAHLQYVADNPLPTVLLWRNYDEVKALFEGEAPPGETVISKPIGLVKEGTAPAVKSQPAQAAQEEQLCSKQINIKGVAYACALPQGHKEEHDYSIEVPMVDLKLEPQEFCGAKVSIRGVTYGCGVVGEHSGDHDYTRELADAKPEPVKEVPAAVAAGSSRAAAVKQRFQTGAGK